MAQVTKELSFAQDVHTPTHLWVGPSEIALKKITALLQKTFCANNGCKTCAQCRMVLDRQHQSIMWFFPEKQYTRDQFAPLFEQLSLQLNKGEKYFFVIEKADFLSPACANSLLKSLEEPPPGYYFFLLAERINLVLPTIRSRSIIHTISSQSFSYARHPLFDFFTSKTFHDPTAFLKAVDQSGISERESLELLDELFSHWVGKRRTSAQNQETSSEKIDHALHILSKAYSRLPMPGSSKLFWKDLFLQLKG